MTENLIFEFHISKKSRAKYKIESTLFSALGNIIIADFRTARSVTQLINETRIAEGRTGELVTAGLLNGLGLLHEILHFIIRYYEEKENPGAFQRALQHLKSKIPSEIFDSTLLRFIEHFPPTSVYNKEIKAEDYLNGKTGGKDNHEIILEEIFLLSIENINPATLNLEELYSDKELQSVSSYSMILEESESFFRNEKTLGAENLTFFEFLKKPILASPYSLEGQLNFIRENWSAYIPEVFVNRLLGGTDLIQEDMRLYYKGTGFDKITPPVPTYDFDKDYYDLLKAKVAAGEQLSGDETRFYYAEYEKFTHDVEWMPKVIMIAKNIFVWCDQLSRKYRRNIKTLDQIPDEELNQLAEWNFTALWLIGIWERSPASRKIKQIMGNPEAAASAYSLYDYVIAGELGGEDAFQNLKYRAAQRGIRLASDMVPNHTGIYSKWVVERPDYFLQSDYPPYPGYSFWGPNLSDDNKVEVRIEDKYYNHTDAAVVFQRKDSHTGDLKYIYHGNDGTHMPWNDTAQLNLLNPEVREALIQTIMHVARKTPIIRFDAAMTLAKKHFQRLWFPQPGTGGAIPSRSDYALTRDDFDRAIPQEFWREVVDRINSEMPETLLLAEAFWLMEGYFVRTLGMHRVYNSAFMHMMMKEENDKYRLLIKNTLEFNAEILKRYVNFMSNPDEETAVNQFGKGDKYFGVSIMMITLPGLPMFAHGQIEGFSEKYGMEYKKAYYNEYTDNHLIQRHRDEIFPLLKKRYLFSQVTDFQFYDFIDNSGNVNENVFAFSNKSGDEKAFVVYNNSYSETIGTVINSFSKPYPGSGYQSTKLAAALNLKDEYNIFYKVYDHRTKLQYLLYAKDIYEFGLYIPLFGYEYRILLGFEEIYDSTGDYQKLYRYLDGRGVFSLDSTMSEIIMAPFHYAFTDMLNESSYREYQRFLLSGDDIKVPLSLHHRIEKGLEELASTKKIEFDPVRVLKGVERDLLSLKNLYHGNAEKKTEKSKKPTESALNQYKDSKALAVLLPQIFLYRVFENSDSTVQQDYSLFDNLLINRVVFSSLNRYMPPDQAGLHVHLIKIMASPLSTELKALFASSSARSKKSIKSFLDKLFGDAEIGHFLNMNEFEGTRYFSKDKFNYLVQWIYLLDKLFLAGEALVETGTSQLLKKLSETADESGFRVDDMVKMFDVKEKKQDASVKKKRVPVVKKKRK